MTNNSRKINSHNEWDKVKEIIVGRPDTRAALIFNDPRSVTADLIKKAERLAEEAYPQWLTDEIGEDLDGLAKVCSDFGADVLRPDASEIHRVFSTPYVTGSAEHAYNARDLYLVVGDMVIESPSQEKHRYFEAQAYYDIWYKYMEDDYKFRWIAGPKPKLKGNFLIPYYEDERKYLKLTENEILFEAANTLRMGRDLLYLVSRSGNYLAAKWLQNILGEEYRVHTTDQLYRSSHIDSTALALRPGLVLLNASRVNERNCPKIFDKWDKIYYNEAPPYPEKTIDFHRKVRVKVYEELVKLNIESNLNGISSEWIGLNILSLDPNTVVIDERQTLLIKELEKHGITCAPISFRHSYYMGGIHCSTLDTVRESKLESYFD